MSLVDDADPLMEPNSGFVCQVAIRHYADELRRIVAIPLEDVRVRHINQAEYMMGYYHQLPVNMVPPDFNAFWTLMSQRGDATKCVDKRPNRNTESRGRSRSSALRSRWGSVSL
ncbi:hypothetical protein PR003_g6413 [Phytophthora rubi]|uniref:Uncharacterized protein n=1 Tax=Phytophthora rubi TaxID=129364 RepID=A0A6A4FPZ4_9STRA|nr:hypothetical protein PR003_g6413 [Phytophthora rubi]